jgi:hypothetical protein
MEKIFYNHDWKKEIRSHAKEHAIPNENGEYEEWDWQRIIDDPIYAYEFWERRTQLRKIEIRKFINEHPIEFVASPTFSLLSIGDNELKTAYVLPFIFRFKKYLVCLRKALNYKI